MITFFALQEALLNTPITDSGRPKVGSAFAGLVLRVLITRGVWNSIALYSL